MLLEGFVGLMAMIAACILDPAIFFAINSSISALGNDAVITISEWGFKLNPDDMVFLANQMGEKTLYARTGGAPSLAVGMAKIFSSAFGSNMLSMWYHFAIMFEAIFILTTLDAGTRVARFMLEDLLRFRDKKLHESNFAGIFSSFIVVSLWGYFLYIGVVDPNGGINILWPLFGMSNQILACIALTLATIIIYKSRPFRYCLITLIPLTLITINTSYAVLEKVFSKNVKIGFLEMANQAKLKLVNEKLSEVDIINLKRIIFNQQLVAFIALFFLTILWIVIIEAVRKIIKYNLK
jgi:carbon starvation protein